MNNEIGFLNDEVVEIIHTSLPKMLVSKSSIYLLLNIAEPVFLFLRLREDMTD